MNYIKKNSLFLLQSWAIQVAIDNGMKAQQGTVYWGSGFVELSNGRWVWKLTDEELAKVPANIAEDASTEMGGTIKELDHFNK